MSEIEIKDLFENNEKIKQKKSFKKHGRKSWGKNGYKEFYNFFTEYIRNPRLHQIFKKGQINVLFEYGEPVILYSDKISGILIDKTRFPVPSMEEKGLEKFLLQFQDYILFLYEKFERDDTRPMKVTDLACLLGVSKQAVDQMIKKMIQKAQKKLERENIKNNKNILDN